MPDQREKYVQLQEAINRHKGEPGALMPVLQEAQNIFGYVPLDVQEQIADGLDTTLSEVYGVATFYSQFSLEPKGQYVVGVCLGTACYVKGSQKVLDKLSEELKIPVGKTTEDGRVTLNADEVYGRLTPDEIPAIIAKYR